MVWEMLQIKEEINDQDDSTLNLPENIGQINSNFTIKIELLEQEIN